VFPADVNLTLTLKPSYTSTITPASFVATASADPQSIAGTSIYGGTTTSSTSVSTTSTPPSSTTSSASAAATTTKKGAGMKVEGNVVLVSVVAILAVVRML
jgi:hypothetical protein